MTKRLPIEAIRSEVIEAGERGPVVITAPPGSGKSTRVPMWLEGRVLVVEPRRVACRALAGYVAETAGEELGEAIGYRVRDDVRATERTRVCFVTPGIALSAQSGHGRGLADVDHIVIDEFHERRMDVDLVLALAHKAQRARLTVMSATMDGDRVAEHLNGTHLKAEGRMFPVDVAYMGKDVSASPSAQGLDARVASAVQQALQHEGDVLVFLPGRGEITACERALSHLKDVDVRPLHGQLPLKAQRDAVRESKRRRVILSTNVAETSLTVPGVGVVIDSGLVRRTHYHRGRSYLAVAAIAQDSADQRAGRAGRVKAGRCLRLWGRAAALSKTTPPEIHRESVVPLVLAAGVHGHAVSALPFLDPPKPAALEAATLDLERLGALDEQGRISEIGSALAKVPTDPWLARVLVEAGGTSSMPDAIDLAAALSLPRPLMRVAREDEADEGEDCDAMALIKAVRGDEIEGVQVFERAAKEARASSKRLAKSFGVSLGPGGAIDRQALLAKVIAADPASVHVARKRKRKTVFSNGGTEAVLGRESTVREEKVEALVVLGMRGVGEGRRRQNIITGAMPITFKEMSKLGLGRERCGRAWREKGRVVVTVERVYARKVISSEERSPRGPLAHAAIAQLISSGTLRKGLKRKLDLAMVRWGLAHKLTRAGRIEGEVPPAPETNALLEARLAESGLEEPRELSLLSDEDLLPIPLPYEIASVLDDQYPLEVEVGGVTYAVLYDLEKSQVVLSQKKGSRKSPPPRSWFPRFSGFKLFVEAGRTLHRL